MSTLHLAPLPEQLRGLAEPVSDEVLGVVDREFAEWRRLHDRLIAIIASAIDVAVAGGQPMQQVLDELVAGTRASLDTLVSSAVEPREIAALLRAHGSTGEITEGDREVRFVHECGSGLRYWKNNPDAPTVAEGEVAGVPGGRTRYCARCMHTIASHAGGWTVQPPASTADRCTWQLAVGADNG